MTLAHAAGRNAKYQLASLRIVAARWRAARSADPSRRIKFDRAPRLRPETAARPGGERENGTFNKAQINVIAREICIA